MPSAQPQRPSLYCNSQAILVCCRHTLHAVGRHSQPLQVPHAQCCTCPLCRHMQYLIPQAQRTHIYAAHMGRGHTECQQVITRSCLSLPQLARPPQATSRQHKDKHRHALGLHSFVLLNSRGAWVQPCCAQCMARILQPAPCHMRRPAGLYKQQDATTTRKRSVLCIAVEWYPCLQAQRGQPTTQINAAHHHKAANKGAMLKKLTRSTAHRAATQRLNQDREVKAAHSDKRPLSIMQGLAATSGLHTCWKEATAGDKGPKPALKVVLTVDEGAGNKHKLKAAVANTLPRRQQ